MNDKATPEMLVCDKCGHMFDVPAEVRDAAIKEAINTYSRYHKEILVRAIGDAYFEGSQAGLETARKILNANNDSNPQSPDEMRAELLRASQEAIAKLFDKHCKENLI